MQINQIKSQLNNYTNYITSIRKLPKKEIIRISIWGNENIANEIAQCINGTVGFKTITNRYAQSSRNYYVEVQ